MIRVARRFTTADARRHWEALRTSSALTQTYRRMYRPEATLIPAEDVIDVLKRAGVTFVVMGTHGVSGWRSEPRATQDVDCLIRRSHHRKAVKAVREAYPALLVEDLPVVTRFKDPATGKEVINLMKPAEPIHQQAFKSSVPIGKTHRVPDLEMALVSKFAAIVSPNRADAKRLIDAGDFVDVAKHNLDAIDMRKLHRLAELIYCGVGADILKCVDDVRAGEVLDVKALASKKELLP